jgi:hypothetical protein
VVVAFEDSDAIFEAVVAREDSYAISGGVVARARGEYEG